MMINEKVHWLRISKYNNTRKMLLLNTPGKYNIITPMQSLVMGYHNIIS
jgi:hypothetical protein